MGPFLWPSAGMPSPLVEDSKAKGYKGKLWEFFVKVLFLLGDSDCEVRKQEASTERECWVWAGFLTILLHHWLEGSGSKNEVTCFKIPTSQRLPLVRTRPQKKTGYLIKFVLFLVLERFPWQILPSISGTCETQKDYCCFRGKNVHSAAWALVPVVRFVLARTLQASSIARPDMALGRASWESRPFRDLFVLNMIPDTMSKPPFL